jgi:hypothetical protein
MQRIAGAAPFAVLLIGPFAVAWMSLPSGTEMTAKQSFGELDLPDTVTAELLTLCDSLFNGALAPGQCAICHGDPGVGTARGPRHARARPASGCRSPFRLTFVIPAYIRHSSLHSSFPLSFVIPAYIRHSRLTFVIPAVVRHSRCRSSFRLTFVIPANAGIQWLNDSGFPHSRE